MPAHPFPPTTDATAGTTSTNSASMWSSCPRPALAAPTIRSATTAGIRPFRQSRSANSGDIVVFGTRDAFDHSLNRNSTAADVVALNLNLVHPLTGPLFVRRCQRRATCSRSRLLDIEPDKFGYTIVVPGFGFLRDVFPDAFIARWDLSRGGATSPDIPGVKIRFDGFMGTIGVAPGPAQVETYFQREAELAAAGGFVLQPQPLDALPERGVRPGGQPQRTVPSHHPAAGKRRQHGCQADAGRHDACSSPASSMAACSPSATFILHRATARCPAPRSRWMRR